MGAKITPSATAAIEAAVAARRGAGLPVYRLGLGEPDFAVAPEIADAVFRAARAPAGYTPTAGVLGLREAIAEMFTARLARDVRPSDVIATAGAKQAIYLALSVVCAADDEVLIPVPYWVSFPEQVRLAGGVPVYLDPPGASDRLSAQSLKANVRDRSRVLILNSPNNPSGIVYNALELEEIAAACVELNLQVISDEVYSAFVFSAGGHRSIATYAGMAQRTIVIDSASKTYGMPGWRLGYATGPRELIEAMVAIASHTTSNASSLAQAAAEAALRGNQESVSSHREEYLARARWLADRIRSIPRIGAASEIEGGFFLWLDLSAFLGSRTARGFRSVDDLAASALDETGVALQPGTAFGSPRHIRMSVAAPEAELRDGVDRLEAFLEGL
jgi:aspartate aminotransferase